MNGKLAQLAIFTSKINRQHIQIFFALMAVSMLVLGIVVPSDGGGSSHGK
jgi:hypothetical protein